MNKTFLFLIFLLSLSSSISFGEISKNTANLDISNIPQTNPVDMSSQSHDFVGWTIAGIGVAITLLIFARQIKIERKFDNIQKSIKTNSLKIINYYLETCGLDIGKTASAVRADILADKMSIEELKQVILKNKFYFEMIEILQRELSFVRPYISTHLYDTINFAADGLTKMHSPEKIDAYASTKVWLDEIINTLNPSIKEARKNIEMELKNLLNVPKKSDVQVSHFHKELTLDAIHFGGIIAVGATIFSVGAALWITSASMLGTAFVPSPGADFTEKIIIMLQGFTQPFLISGVVLIIAGFVAPMIKYRYRK